MFLFSITAPSQECQSHPYSFSLSLFFFCSTWLGQEFFALFGCLSSSASIQLIFRVSHFTCRCVFFMCLWEKVSLLLHHLAPCPQLYVLIYGLCLESFQAYVILHVSIHVPFNKGCNCIGLNNILISHKPRALLLFVIKSIAIVFIFMF